MGPTFAVAAVGAAIWLARVPSFPAGLTLAMAVMFSVFGFWGARLATRRNAGALADLERLRVTLGRSITEYRIETDRVVVASERDGDDETFWFFRDEADRSWLAVEDGLWTDLNVAARTWNREVRIAVDAERRVVSIATSGAPVSVEHRELQPPDYEPTPTTLFWTRPQGLGPAPFIVRNDPTVSP
jgi:hypothetical protein